MIVNCNHQVSEKVFLLGVNDRRKQLFENLWPLPQGVAYNSYLIRDQKCALLDTVEAGSDGSYPDRVTALLQGRKLDYLIIHHMEPDHSGEIETLIARYPEVKVVGNSKTFQILCAYLGPLPNLMEVHDGDTLALGHHILRFVFTPWVHWPETMMSYDQTEGILFSGDAFGSFGTLDGAVFDDQADFSFYEGEMRRYYSNIVGKYSRMVQKAFEKLSGVDIHMICPLHGLLWRSNPSQVLALYRKWSHYEAENGAVVIYGSMYGNTARMADCIASGLAAQGVGPVRVHDVSKTHTSYLLSDLWRYKGVVLGSCAYNAEMFPLMESLTRDLLHIGLKNRVLGLFGTYSWSGGGVKNLKEFAEEIGWKQPAEAIEIKGRPDPEKLSVCDGFVEALACALRA